MRKAVTSLLIAALLVSGCATTAPATGAAQQAAKPANIKQWMESRPRRNMVVGIAAGVLAGAISAKLSGAGPDGVLNAAIAGGIAGGVAGYAVGKRQDKIYAHRDYAISHAGYEPSQGYIARVEAVTLDPPQPKPGDTATIYVRYFVIGPNPQEKIRVRMFRGLKYGEDYIFGAGPTDFAVPKGGGVIEATMEMTLPKRAPQGTYTVEAVVADPRGRFREAMGSGALYVVARAHERGAVAAAR